ncbi:RNA cap guanine-N2 methyltransferase-domain-containing protein [Cladorrhinum sp. PSN259]|nr:RNA cap guanine-N2 methyltransferase-domain-containing protein [Cladorrhinum sp. PSN259]
MTVLRPLSDRLPLTNKCHHYDEISEVPKHLQKYWYQRYSIFQYYDYDIRLTDDAWFGVTPEPIALQLAHDISPIPSTSPSVIIDLFGGVGGNAIAFALSSKWSKVIAIERDISTLACAQHNASIYGVEEHITFIHGDCLDFLSRLKNNPASLDESLRVDLNATTLFASPPWGGVDYAHHDVFDLSKMEPYNLEVLHEACKPMEHALYLPRTSDIQQLAELVPQGRKEKMDVVQYCMEGASKALVAYVPAEGGYGDDDGDYDVGDDDDDYDFVSKQ